MGQFLTLQYKLRLTGQFSELQAAVRIPVFLSFSGGFPAFYSIQLAVCTALTQPKGVLRAHDAHRCAQMASALRHLPCGSTWLPPCAVNSLSKMLP